MLAEIVMFEEVVECSLHTVSNYVITVSFVSELKNYYESEQHNVA